MNAEVRPIKTAAETALGGDFAAGQGERLPGRAARSRRCARQAFRRFERGGLPHRRVEEWKYTDLRALMRDAKPLAGPPDAAAKARAEKRGRHARDRSRRAASCSSTARSCRNSPISPTSSRA